MPFNWEGDLILQNTLIEKKRYVIGSENIHIRTDIREWISFEDNIIMKEILSTLAREKNLPKTKLPGDFDRRAKIIWDFVARTITYVHDNEKQNKEDFWLFPPEIYVLKKGDCEDGSFLLASLLIASGISPFCVRLVLGEVFDEQGTSLGGHCWPVYKNEMGVWCILESTLNKIPARFPEADKLSEQGQYFQYVPYYCFNSHHLWMVFPKKERETKSPQGLDRYFRLRRRKVNMKTTRLPSGGWLSRITGDWEPGHFDITTEALKEFGFAGEANDVSGDASQDPDFYDWYTPSAHAQTENDEEGRTSETKEQACSKYTDWIKELTGRLLNTTPKDIRTGLFFLGYVLHGIQDLATHKGITNAQHAYISKLAGKKNDPDHSGANRDKANEYTRRYLEFLKTRYATHFKRLRDYKGRGMLWERLIPSEKRNVLKKDGWDLTAKAFLEYNSLAERYKEIRRSYPV